MRLAIVDLGTNTFNLLIAEVSDTGFKTVHKEKKAVKLGKSGINSGMIAPDAYRRGLTAMNYYSETIEQFKVDKIIAAATSAMRDSKNASEFISEVKQTTGIEIEVISGEKEAQLIQQGVAITLPSNIQDYVIMDIGGGSTEFIIIKNNKTVWSKSYDLGVSRLLDWLKPENPISPENIQTLQTRLNKELVELYKNIATHQVKTLIGSSGSFDSIHDMLASKNESRATSDELDFSEISLDEINQQHSTLLASTLAERLEMDGLVQMRADMMVISSIEIHTVLEKCTIEKVYRSAYALKEGLLVGLMPS